ncbi:FAD-binding oxidoreductase [Mycolicibacterium sp. CBM1]
MTTFTGAFYRHGDDGYEQARCAAVWNGLKPSRFPAVIVVAANQDDVVRAVKLANAEGLTVGIRSGGHNWVGNHVRDGGLLLDLSQLKNIDIDPLNRTAIVEPGVHNADFAAALLPHNLYFPVGHCPTVGMGGYILGGGMGFNSIELGPAALSMYAIDVVTADGQIVHATDEEHADLLWAARGSGPGFFAIMIRMYLELRPMPAIAATVQIHPLSAFDELLPWYLDVASLGTPGLLIAGSNPAFGHDDTVLTIAAYAFGEDLEHAAQRLAPLENAPGLDRAIFHQSPFLSTIDQLQVMFDGMYPEGLRYLSDNLWIKDEYIDDPGLWQESRAILDSLPSARSCLWFIPGLPEYRDPRAAFSLQTRMSIQAYAVWDDGAQDDEMAAWHTGAMARVDRYTVGGGYVGDSNLFVHPMAILDPPSAERTEALRAKYDPQGRFFSYPVPLPVARL